MNLPSINSWIIYSNSCTSSAHGQFLRGGGGGGGDGDVVEAWGQGAGAEGGLWVGYASAQHLAACGIVQHQGGGQCAFGQQQGDTAVGGVGREGEGQRREGLGQRDVGGVVVGGVGHGAACVEVLRCAPGSVEDSVVDGAYVATDGTAAGLIVDVGAEGAVGQDTYVGGVDGDGGQGVGVGIIGAVANLILMHTVRRGPHEGGIVGLDAQIGEVLHLGAGIAVGVRRVEEQDEGNLRTHCPNITNMTKIG